METNRTYWWCPECREIVVSEDVTYEYKHRACGKLVKGVFIVPEPEYDRLKALDDLVPKLVEALGDIAHSVRVEDDLGVFSDDVSRASNNVADTLAAAQKLIAKDKEGTL